MTTMTTMTNRADTYQGHLPDGSSVQAHSAGGLYPFVLFAKDGPNGKLVHGYIDPRDGSEHLVGTYDQTVARVEQRIARRARAKQAEALRALGAYGLLACTTPVPEQGSQLAAGQDAVAQRANLARQARSPDAPRHDYLSWNGK